MPIAVIADSAAALEPALASQYGIVTVPMQLEVGGKPLGEREISLDELVARLDDGVQTSAPPPGAFLEVLEAAKAEGADGAVVLTVGGNLSSTFQSASTAATLAGEDWPVAVVDTGTAAGAEGLVVLAAAET